MNVRVSAVKAFKHKQEQHNKFHDDLIQNMFAQEINNIRIYNRDQRQITYKMRRASSSTRRKR